MPPTGLLPAAQPAPEPRRPGHDLAEGQHPVRRSRFTYRHLADMAAASTTCPLRVISHLDLDAYYAQCEMLRLGTDDETPLVVQQW